MTTEPEKYPDKRSARWNLRPRPKTACPGNVTENTLNLNT